MLCMSPLFSVLDVTRHQVCAGGIRETVQTNYWPGFLFKENKPSRWDTLVMFWEGSLIQGISMDMCGAPGCRSWMEEIISVVNPGFYWKWLFYTESWNPNLVKMCLYICIFLFCLLLARLSCKLTECLFTSSATSAVSAISHAYSLWKLFSAEQTVHFLLYKANG